MRIYLENARNTEEIFPDVHCPLSFCLPLHLPWIYLMWVILYALESKCPGTCRGPQDWIQVTWLGSRHPYMLSHLTSPLSVSFSNNRLAQISFGHHCVRGSSWFISEGTHSASDSSRNGDTRGTGLTLLSVTVDWFGAFLDSSFSCVQTEVSSSCLHLLTVLSLISTLSKAPNNSTVSLVPWRPKVGNLSRD